MRIAIQFFGHLRTYEKCWSSIEQYLLKKYDCDVFMHTWDTIDHNTQTWHNYRVPDTHKPLNELKDELKWIYSLKALEVEKQIVKDEGVLVCQGKPISIFGMRSMLHSMKRVNSLREEYQKQHNVKYDYVLVLRPDVKLLRAFNFYDYANPKNTSPEILNNSLYIAGFYKFKYLLNDFRFIGASDVLFFGVPSVISKIYSNTEQIFEQIKDINTSKYGPEYSFIYKIEKLGITPKLINYLHNDAYEIVRGEDKSVAPKKEKFSLKNLFKRRKK